jgi:hypothetical protein
MMKAQDENGKIEKGRKVNGYTSYLQALNAEPRLFNVGLSFGPNTERSLLRPCELL